MLLSFMNNIKHKKKIRLFIFTTIITTISTVHNSVSAVSLDFRLVSDLFICFYILKPQGDINILYRRCVAFLCQCSYAAASLTDRMCFTYGCNREMLVLWC